MKFFIRLIIIYVINMYSVKLMKLLRSPYFNRDNFMLYKRNVYISNFTSFPETLPADNPNNSTSYIKFLWTMRNFNLSSIESREVNHFKFTGLPCDRLR